MADFSSESVSGGSSGPAVASKGKRFAAGVIDLILIPILIGIVAGLLLLNAPEGLRNVLLILINIAWMIFRDAVFSPGRKMVGTRLVSLAGDKVSIGQAFIRNILLIVPFVLVIGYIVELVSLLVKGERVADGWAKTRVIEATA
ncbi:MAG: RDD family protein [Candidatus Omnitrophica bacterium]|nr:RDD family protein [Candidatus Omnitrophota bacterium]